MVRTERDQIAAACAGRNTSRIIVGIRIGPRTSRLKYPRISRRLTRLRAPKATRTTVPRRVKCRASALTRHHAPVIAGSDLQTHRTHLVQVADAPRPATCALSSKWRDGDG